MSLVGRLFVIFFSLILAIVAAGLALALGVMLPDVVTLSTDPVEHFTFFVASFFATSFVGYVAFVPALVLIAIAETVNIRTIFYYAIAGAGIGLFAYYGSNISVAVENSTDMPPVAFSLQLVAAAGIIGGFVYWLFAGRNAGRWKNPLAAL